MNDTRNRGTIIRAAAAAAAVAVCLLLTGCARYVSDLVHRNDPEAPASGTSDTSGASGAPEPPDLIKGPITTADALEDIEILGRLAMPQDFVVSISDDDEKMGSTSVTMEMHLGESASIARFTDFKASYGDVAIDIPDFELYMGNSALYLSEGAMCASLALGPQIELLSEAVKAEGSDADSFSGKNAAYADAVAGIISETCDGGFIKLTASEASAVPAIFATPVSSGMISGFFGKDLGFVSKAFEDRKDIFCSDEGGAHVFSVDKDSAEEFFDALLSLGDDEILGLAMADSYDDPLWTSISEATWAYYADAVQACIDSYKKHWAECRDAVKAGSLDYSYRLSLDIDSDTDIEIRLEMSTVSDGSKIRRVIEIKSADKPESIALPSGDKILTPEQWQSKVEPVSDKYLGPLTETGDTSSGNTE